MTIKKSPRVAVIGAGISGVLAAAHLRRARIDVVVFERSAAAGGIWLYDENLPLEPAYPSNIPSVVEYFEADAASGEQHDDQLHSLKHAPPGPCYVGLKNNVPTPLLRTKLNRWPDGTADIVSHVCLNAYIQETSSENGVDSITVYNTAVVHIEKRGSEWNVQTITLNEDHTPSPYEKFSKKDWFFDAVVVCSGHYHACNVPDIAGLAECKRQWPHRVMHSKGYRRPDGFQNQNVLLVGAGVSSTDIAQQLGPIIGAGRIYQSSRGGQYDLSPEMLPPNAQRIGAIDSFDLKSLKGGPANSAQNADPISVVVNLKDGHQIDNIHRIILCTGYHNSYPYLRQYHNDDMDAASASDTVLVTDGTQIHNLHKDIFYIPDPSLAFVGVPYYTATFTLFEFQAIAVAAVFAGRARLPDQSSMRAEYAQKLMEKGAGRTFHSLKGEGEEVGYANSLVQWVNQYGGYGEGGLVEGHSEEWHKARAAFFEALSRLRLWNSDKKPNS